MATSDLSLERRLMGLVAVVYLAAAAMVAAPAAAVAAATSLPAGDTCETCHFDVSRLRATAGEPAEADRYWVDQAAYATERHPFQCVVCHKGQSPAPTKQAAHETMLAKPDGLDVLARTCGQEKCHAVLAQRYPTSLHATLRGLEQGAREVMPADYAEWLFSERCYTCHATCADCHLEEPGGTVRVSTHEFAREPVSETCASCHDQTGTGFLGYEGHFRPSLHASAGLKCSDCHSSTEVHGTGETLVRLKEAIETSCEGCHQNPGATVAGKEVPQFKAGNQNVAHAIHESTLDCTACHVEWNYNCYGCHGYDAQGNPAGYDRFDTNVYLARNPETGKVGTVVHAPMSTKVGGRAFANGAWTFKNRHSIQLRPRECQDCHSDPTAFITGRMRQAPFVVGSVKGQFLTAEELTGSILISSDAARTLARNLLPSPSDDAATSAEALQPAGSSRPVPEHVAVRIARWCYLAMIPAILGVFAFWIGADVYRRARERRVGGGRGPQR